jgi:membrane protease YdiL (CAAX protease family)
LTEPSPPEDDLLPTNPVPPPDPTTPAPSRTLGLTDFTIEGRRAPALFVVGWLGVLIGTGLLAIGLSGGTGLAADVLSLAASAALSLGLVLLCGSQTIERRTAGATYAGPSPVLVFLAIIATSRLAGYVVGVPLLAVAESVPRPLGDLLAVIVQAVVFLGVVRLTVVGPGVLSWSGMGLERLGGNVLRSLLGGAVFAGPVILVTSVIAFVAVQAVGVVPPSPLPPTGTPTGLILHLLAGAVIAPFYEEVLFRGFALNAWRQTFGARGAIVRSSILFVLAHMLFVGGATFDEAVRLAFVGGVVRIPIALALGWLYVRTGSLWGPIGLHAAFNGILIALGEAAVGQ